MKIIPLHAQPRPLPTEAFALFSQMQHSLKAAHADFDKSVRIAKTLAPILNDQTSNTHHLETIESSACTEEKVIATLMLGFPKNRAILPTLQRILLHNSSEALRMAAALAISQMRNGENNLILTEVLSSALASEESPDVQQTIRQVISGL